MKDYNFKVKETTENLILWIRAWFNKNGKGCKAVLGMSGGKDSTITAALLAKAIGPENVIGVIMPDKGQNDNGAFAICKELGIQYIYAPIDKLTEAMKPSNVINGFCWQLCGWSEQAEQNIPPRMRMVMLYAISQTLNGRVINTCNLSENYIGYETIFGDGAGDMSPLGNLTVTEIRAIGDYLCLPEEWVYKTPDDGLPHSTSDEQKFGFTYADLDNYLRGVAKLDAKTADKVEHMHDNSEFKRHPMAAFVPSDEFLFDDIKQGEPCKGTNMMLAKQPLGE